MKTVLSVDGAALAVCDRVEISPESASEVVDYWKARQVHDFVYFISEIGTSAVKIGSAGDPIARLGALQTGNPRRLQLRAVIVSWPGAEPYLHAVWSRSRLVGEWFADLDGSILTWASRASRVQLDRSEALAGIASLRRQEVLAGG